MGIPKKKTELSANKPPSQKAISMAALLLVAWFLERPTETSFDQGKHQERRDDTQHKQIGRG